MGSRLYKRGGVWYCWGYDSNAKRWRESTKQTDRKAAEIVAREIARRRAVDSSSDAPIKLHDALLMVSAADKRAGRSEATADILRLKGRHLVAFFGASFNIRSLTRGDLEEYADRRIASVSRHTAAKELWVLRRAMRVSGAGWSDALMPDLGRIYTPRDRWLTWGEYNALRAQLSAERRDYLDAFVYTGCRRSELYALIASDIDDGRILIRGTKTDEAHRWVPIAKPIAAMLARRAKKSGPLFAWWDKDTRDINAACKRAKIANVSPNDLRRTFASWLANAGVSPLVTARLMGHTSTRMVERVYARLGIEIQADAIAKLPGGNAGEPHEAQKVEEVDAEDDESPEENSDE